MTLEDQVFGVFTESLKRSADADRDHVKYNETANWDSVGHMALVYALEDRFEIMIDTEEVLDMSSFEKAVTIIERHK